jgi:hypothetical protein
MDGSPLPPYVLQMSEGPNYGVHLSDAQRSTLEALTARSCRTCSRLAAMFQASPASSKIAFGEPRAM